MSITLNYGIKGNSYRVRSCNLPLQMEKRLEALGMTMGTSILVLNKKGDGIMIVKIRGTRFAIGANISKRIEVENE